MTKLNFQKAVNFLKKKQEKKITQEVDVIETSLRTQSLSESIRSLDSTFFSEQNQKEEECLRRLVEECHSANIPISYNMIFRFAAYYNFNYELSRVAIAEKFDDPHLHLRMEGELLEQFESLVVFPLPGPLTKNNKHEVVYFQAARHFPSETDTDLLIKNMCYVFNDMSLTEEQCRNGVVLIADLNNWTFKNFTNECANQFLNAMQHQVPTKVAFVLVVNAPKWFPKTWKVLKKMVAPSFAKRFIILKQTSELNDYLMDGYENYLPTEMGYWRDSAEILEDYIDLKLHDEANHR